MNDTSAETTEAAGPCAEHGHEHPGAVPYNRAVEIMRAAQMCGALKVWVEASGPFDDEAQEAFNVTAAGDVREGGLTDAGKAFAKEVSEGLYKIRDEVRKTHRPVGPAVPGMPDARELLDALGMRGPIRAAARAAAQALAVALNDGASDDADTDDGPAGEGLERVALGRVPFVLLQAEAIEGTPYGSVSVMVGGGLKYGRDAAEGELTVEEVIDMAMRGIAEYTETGAKGSGVTLGDPPADQVAKFEQMLQGVFGPDAKLVRNDRQGESDEAFPRAAPDASGSGPSTEDPAMPSWGDDPRKGDGWSESPAPPAPARETPSEPVSVPDNPRGADTGLTDSAGPGSGYGGE